MIFKTIFENREIKIKKKKSMIFKTKTITALFFTSIKRMEKIIKFIKFICNLIFKMYN